MQPRHTLLLLTLLTGFAMTGLTGCEEQPEDPPPADEPADEPQDGVDNGFQDDPGNDFAD